jgi:hypothetical protein
MGPPLGKTNERRATFPWHRSTSEDYGPEALDQTFRELAHAARRFEGPDGFSSPMSAHIVTAAR